ncbi:MAG: alkaline phosphatase family protein, partial [Polyangiaceae bacterium]
LLRLIGKHDRIRTAPGESTSAGGRKFPHQVGGPGITQGFRLLPEADALLVDLAIGSLALLKPGHPMLLSVSFWTHDIVGHSFGPNSWEAWSELAALDAELARLLNALDEKLGSDGYSVVLSADHGIVPMPEFVKQKRPDYCGGAPDPYERPCTVGIRAQSGNLEKSLNAALQKLFASKEPLVSGIVDSRLILSPAARALPAPQQQRLDQVLRVLLKQDPSVADVFLISSLGECPAPTDESIPALVCRGNTENVSSGFYNTPGDYYIVLKPGQLLGLGGRHQSRLALPLQSQRAAARALSRRAARSRGRTRLLRQLLRLVVVRAHR